MNQIILETVRRGCRALILLTALCPIASCSGLQREVLPRIQAQPKAVTLPPGNYYFPVLLSDSTLAVMEQPQTGSDKLLILNLPAGTTYETPVWQEGACNQGNLTRLKRLEVGKVAIMQECYYSDPGQIFGDYLYSWDMKAHALTRLQQYPRGFRAGDFAFAPDMSRGLQEEMGDGINNRLYTVDQMGNLTRVFTDSYRIGSPDWSADGNRIAFALTENAPKERSSIFTGLVGIDNALAQPWTIYTANPDFSDQKAIIERVNGVRSVQWSPNQRLLAFNADNYRGNEGVFAIDLQTNSVTQVWSEDVDFDWSPSGAKMVLSVPDSDSDNSIQPRQKLIMLDVTEIY